MILDSQNQFRKDFIESLPHASSAAELVRAVEASPMPAAYKSRFTTWVGTLGDTVIRLSAEEKARAFVDFLDQDIRREFDSLIQGEDENARRLRQLAGRGQLLLVSRDEGKTFTEILTPEEAENEDPLKVQILSPSLRGVTSNLSEVLDEQGLLQAKKRLTDQDFLVQNARMEGRSALLDVVSPKGVPYTVTVDMSQVLSKPLEFTFVNAEGLSKTVSETQLPETYGEIEFKLPETTEKIRLPEQRAEISPLQVPPPLPPLPPRAQALGAGESGAFSILPQETHLNNLVDVMAAKVRLARQKAELEKSQKRENERYANAQEEAEKSRAVERQQTQETKTNFAGRSGLLKGLIGGGAVATVTGASVGVPVWLSLITGLTS